MTVDEDKKPRFDVDEVLTIKGLNFKVIFTDGFTGTIGLKYITEAEAKILKDASTKTQSQDAFNASLGK